MPVGGCLNSSISACKLSLCLIPQTATGLPSTCSVSRCSKPSSVPSLSASVLCEQPGESPSMPIVYTPPGRKLSHRLLDHIALVFHWPQTPFCLPRLPGPLPVEPLPGLLCCKTLFSPSSCLLQMSLWWLCPLFPSLFYFLSGRACPMLCCLLPNIRTSQLPSRYLQISPRVRFCPSQATSLGGRRCSAVGFCLSAVFLRGRSFPLRAHLFLNPLCFVPSLYPTLYLLGCTALGSQVHQPRRQLGFTLDVPGTVELPDRHLLRDHTRW